MANDFEKMQLVYGYPVDGPYDFELWYDNVEKKYSFSIETLIEFNDEDAAPKNFVRNILKEFALENDSIVTLAERVEKIIPEMKEINFEAIKDREDSLERWLAISDPVEGYLVGTNGSLRSF